MLRRIVIALSLFVFFDACSAEQRTFRGKWNNRKFNSSGTMTCVAEEMSTGKWTAVFRGVFQGDPFEFEADFRSDSSGQKLSLTGQHTIRGAQYQWTGSLTGQTLRGRYRASNGFNGEFVLNETAASGREPATSSQPESLDDVEIAPVIRDGRLLFVGNSFMANEGGVYEYLQLALQKRGIEITFDSKIYYGKSLREMVTPEVGKAITAPDIDAVVITSGDTKIIKQFAKKLKGTGKKLIVFMTWELQHPGNKSSPKRYTSATRKSVREMRQIEEETGARIIPAAVLYHDLTVRPPDGVPRIDYLWKKEDIHQNELGTMVNAWLMVAMITGETPIGLNFNMPPFLVGQRIQSEPDFRLTRDLRQELQYRTWAVAQAWTRGKSHLE